MLKDQQSNGRRNLWDRNGQLFDFVEDNESRPLSNNIFRAHKLADLTRRYSRELTDIPRTFIFLLRMNHDRQLPIQPPHRYPLDHLAIGLAEVSGRMSSNSYSDDHLVSFKAIEMGCYEMLGEHHV